MNRVKTNGLFVNPHQSQILASEDVKKELGDILWFVAGLCSVYGMRLSDIAQMNIDKLESRKQRNTIKGDGDNR